MKNATSLLLILLEKNHESININNINKTSINIKIKELEKLVKEVKHRQLRANFERDLVSYRAIKKIFEDAEKE